MLGIFSKEGSRTSTGHRSPDQQEFWPCLMNKIPPCFLNCLLTDSCVCDRHESSPLCPVCSRREAGVLAAAGRCQAGGNGHVQTSRVPLAHPSGQRQRVAPLCHQRWLPWWRKPQLLFRLLFDWVIWGFVALKGLKHVDLRVFFVSSGLFWFVCFLIFCSDWVLKKVISNQQLLFVGIYLC